MIITKHVFKRCIGSAENILNMEITEKEIERDLKIGLLRYETGRKELEDILEDAAASLIALADMRSTK